MAARRDPVPGAVGWNPAHAGTATVAGPGRGAVVRMWSESGPATGAGLLAGTVGAGLRSAVAGAHSAHGMAPFSFSLGGQSDTESSGSAWSVWGRGDVRRFESGHDGTSHDGTMTGVYLGADVGADDWLAGVSVLRSDAETDYRFDRTVDACGGVGVGEGRLVAELTSVHPYAARRLGRGWVWAAFGAGRGEASVERCGPGNVDEADLKVRLAALGGRHPFAYRDRLVVSVVEDVGVLGMTTGASSGSVGDRSVSVGRARLGLEAAGVAPPGCKCSLATYVPRPRPRRLGGRRHGCRPRTGCGRALPEPTAAAGDRCGAARAGGALGGGRGGTRRERDAGDPPEIRRLGIQADADIPTWRQCSRDGPLGRLAPSGTGGRYRLANAI